MCSVAEGPGPRSLFIPPSCHHQTIHPFILSLRPEVTTGALHQRCDNLHGHFTGDLLGLQQAWWSPQAGAAGMWTRL